MIATSEMAITAEMAMLTYSNTRKQDPEHRDRGFKDVIQLCLGTSELCTYI